MNPDKCKYCGSNLKLELTPNMIHYGRLDCVNCNRFNGWARNPEGTNYDSKRIGSRADVRKVAEYHKMNQENPICFFCLRKKEQLGVNETLTVDHIQELDIGGKDEVYNMQILCSACHKLKNWARLYVNWHLNGKGDDYGNS